MSRGLGKVEREILKICQSLLTLKDRWQEENKEHFQVYHGGARNYLNMNAPSKLLRGTRLYEGKGDMWQYCRVVHFDGEKYDLPDDILDLKEVSAVYQGRLNKFFKSGLTLGGDTVSQASFSRAVKSLKTKAYLQEEYDFTTRFVRLNTEKAKCYEIKLTHKRAAREEDQTWSK